MTAEQLRAFTGLNKAIPNKELEARLRAQSGQASASDAPTPVTVVNSASLLTCGLSTNPNKCTNGMFVTFYISPNATSETGTFNFPWRDTLSDGFQLRYESCTAPPTNARETRILGVYQFSGYQQVNVYVQGDVLQTQGEPFGQCNLVNNGFTATFNVRGGFGSPFRTAYGTTYFESVNMNFATPAIFSQNGSGTGGAPAGYHYIPGAGVYTELRQCNVDPSRCPLTTNGLSNYMVLFSTGAENIQCNSLVACQQLPFQPGITLRDSAGASFTLTPDFIGEVQNLGQEQWNIPISTLQPSNQYTLTVVSGLSDVSVQSLAVRFGPGN